MSRLLTGGAVDTAIDEQEPEGAASSGAILEGTAPAVGVLALLNHPATTLKVLDDDVPLDKRAAENLIARRNGADGIGGNADDKRYLSIAEVDAVAFVGPAALDALTKYAELADWVPTGDDLLGAWDDVPFTAAQAEATLVLANTASRDVLDHDVPLDVRAVDAIVAARPIESILELSGLYYVGASALLHLRDFDAPKPVGTAGSDCAIQADCNAGLLCTGRPSDEDPAPKIGKCVDTSDVPGEDLPCNATTPCGAGLVCMGTSVPWTNGNGWCRAEWMSGTFRSTTAMPIAEGSAATTSSVVVYGLATVPEDVLLTLDIDHPRPQDLVVTIRQPSSAETLVFNHVANPEIRVPVLGEYDSYVNGTWECEIRDTVTGQTGGLRGFQLEVNSRWD